MGEKIRKARHKLRLTLRALAKLVGVSRQAIWAYEQSKYPPTTKVWNRLKKALGLEGDILDYFTRKAFKKGRPRKYGKNELCRVENCPHKIKSKGLCSLHYEQQRRGKKPGFSGT